MGRDDREGAPGGGTDAPGGSGSPLAPLAGATHEALGAPGEARAELGAPGEARAERSAAERRRLAAATRLLPGTDGDPALDRLTALAARLLGAPTSQVSLLTTEQVVAGAWGVPAGTVGRASPLEASLCTVTAASGGAMVVSDATADQRVAHLPPVVAGAVVAYLGIPLVTSNGETVGALCVYGPQPRRWSAYDVGVLEGLAESVVAELELSALSAEFELRRLRWDLASDAAEIGFFEADVDTRRLEFDERAAAIYGYGPGERVVDRAEVLERVHPDDLQAVESTFAAALASGWQYRSEYRLVLPGGLRWVSVRGQFRGGRDGRRRQLVGAVYDDTEARTAGDRAAHLLATMSTGFVALDRDWRITYLNAAGERMLATAATDAVGRVLWEAFPGLEAPVGDRLATALRASSALDVETFYPPLDAWFEIRVEPGSDGAALYVVDITARHLAQQQAEAARIRAEEMQRRAEHGAARLALLAELSAQLLTELEPEAAVTRLARLVVPTLADWCTVVLLDEDGSPATIGSWHADEALRPVVERFAAHRFDGITAPQSVHLARDQRRPVIVTSGATESAVGRLASPVAVDAMRALAPESTATLPMIARDRVVGVLTLCRGAGREPLSDDGLSAAIQVADRAAVGLDNARLYRQQRGLSERLQRSLLTAPPEPDHLHIAVRYAPAAETASVGGDWYDAFLQPDGATVLVIGDVIGHDTEAAAAMGQLRGVLRGVAWSSGDSPSGILACIDAAVETLALATTATAVVARLEQSPEQAERGQRTLRWSNAGHPPPLVHHRSTGVTVLAADEPDLLLGIDPDSPRADATVVLEPESTVVLYTDGLVERRDEGLDAGIDRLRATLADLAGLPLEALCDQLLERMLPERADDDVALLAVRLHPEDR